jgi:quercetin dioxygenase-like cupin family protein
MRVERTGRVAVAVGVLVLVAGVVVGRAQQSGGALVDPEHRRMQPEAAETAIGSGVQMTVYGDPSKPGLYAIRRRFKPGEMSMPHYHDQARLVTVIKGTWWSGEGDAFDPAKTVPMKPGSFMLHPAGLHHFDGAKNEEVIVQIIGMGPVKTIDVDAAGKPIRTR